MMTIDENLMCSFQVLKPDEKAGSNSGARPPTPNKKVNILILFFNYSYL